MVNLDDFSIDKYEITKKTWDAIRLWAKDKGYADLSVGRGKGNCPVGSITWYDAVKFTNAMSELAGLTPVYYCDKGEVYRSGNIDNIHINKDADGYRLPTKEEWIYAAKGNTTTPYFWGDTAYPDCIPYVWQFKLQKPGYKVYPGQPEMFGTFDEITHEVGTKLPNPFGLYDMIGNVCEWCIDEYMGVFRTLMGASVALDAVLKTEHTQVVPPDYKCYETGMRVVSNCPNAVSSEELAEKSEFYGVEQWPKPVYPDMSEQAIAERLYAQLDESGFSKEIKSLIEQKEYSRALEKFRNKKMADFRDRYNITEYIHRVNRSDEELLALKDIFDVDFYSGNNQYDVYEGMPESEYLAQRYVETNDERYLDAYLLIVKAYLVRQKAEHDTLTDEQMLDWNDTPATWAWGNGFNPGKRSLHIMTSVALLAKNLTEAEYSKFPADIFTELSISLMTYGLYPSLKDGRDEVPNQIGHTTSWVLSIVDVFKDFSNADIFESYIAERCSRNLGNVIYPDGTAAEQALNYNQGIVSGFCDVLCKYSDLEKLDSIKNTIAPMSRMITALTPPLNITPMTGYTTNVVIQQHGKDYFEYISKIYPKQIPWIEYDRIKNLFINPDGDKPEFKSVYFPYGGTAVIRSGWARDSKYMYFFAPRAGSGHSDEGVCDVQIQAYGREMIKTGGRKSYNQIHNVLPEQRHMIAEVDSYMRESFSQNTVVVDGMGQCRMRYTEQVRKEKYDTATGYRWHDSDMLTYCEGCYSDGYYSTDDVVHKREVVFLKSIGIWIIVDRLHSKAPHKYTQIWHLPIKGEVFKANVDGKDYQWDIDGFDEKDIVTGKNCIYTKEKNAANVFIRHMCDMGYSRHMGELNPAHGWTSYESSIGFRYYPDMEIHCNFDGEGKKTIITVIEASPKEESILKDYRRNGDVLSFMVGNTPYKITNNNGEVRICEGNDMIILDDNRGEYCEIVNGRKIEFAVPTGMQWVEKDNYYFPEYQ